MAILPISAFACVVPMGGKEFDKLIQVEKIAKNTFYLKVAKNAKGLNFGADINVVYNKNDNQNYADSYIRTLKITEDSDYYISTFKLQKIDGYSPRVEVF